MTDDLQGQVAIVTGGGRGFGRAIAECYARAGASVVVTSRTESELADTADAIRCAGGQALAVPADVTEPDAVRRVHHEATSAFGPASLVVHGAGVFGPFGPIWEVDPDEWWRAQAVHVRGAALLMSTFAPDMIARGGGRFIVLTSSASRRLRANHSSYHLAKHTQNHLVSHLAAEGKPHGIKAWAVHPGMAATDMADDAIQSESARRYIPDVVESFQQQNSEEEVRARLRTCADYCLAVARGRADQLSGAYLVATEGLEEVDARIRRAGQSKAEKKLRRAASKARRLMP